LTCGTDEFYEYDAPRIAGVGLGFSQPAHPDERPIMTPQSIKPVKVKVIDRWRVVHPDDGTAHVKGDTFTVPEHVAEEWERSRWVERVTK
jgi:hypothetical protein